MTDNAWGVLAIIVISLGYIAYLIVTAWLDAQIEMQTDRHNHELELLERNSNDRT